MELIRKSMEATKVTPRTQPMTAAERFEADLGLCGLVWRRPDMVFEHLMAGAYDHLPTVPHGSKPSPIVLAGGQTFGEALEQMRARGLVWTTNAHSLAWMRMQVRGEDGGVDPTKVAALEADIREHGPIVFPNFLFWTDQDPQQGEVVPGENQGWLYGFNLHVRGPSEDEGHSGGLAGGAFYHAWGLPESQKLRMFAVQK